MILVRKNKLVNIFWFHWLVFFVASSTGCCRCTHMDQRLILAAQEGDINSLYDLLREDPYILETIDVVPFIETPIHTAASHGQTDFVFQVMILKPSLGRKLNLNGFCPIHLSMEKRDFETVSGLIAMDKDLVRVKGKHGMTPLHTAVVDMLSACPDSIKDLTAWRNTPLHLAVKNNRFKALRVLMEHIYVYDEENIFLCKDNEGYTVLHLMVVHSRLKMIKYLCRCYPDDDSKLFGINAMYGTGQTAMDILEDRFHPARRNSINYCDQVEMKKILYRNGAFRSNMPNSNSTNHVSSIVRSMYLSTPVYTARFKRINQEAQSALLVVAALIATVTFQAGINPPGGFWQDTTTTTAAAVAGSSKQNQAHMAGTSVLAVSRPSYYAVIMAFNFMGFMCSVCFIILLTVRLPLRGLMATSLYFTTATYLLSLAAVYWNDTVYTGGFISLLLEKIYHSPAIPMFFGFGIFLLLCYLTIPGIKTICEQTKMDDYDNDDDDNHNNHHDHERDGNDNDEHHQRDVIISSA